MRAPLLILFIFCAGLLPAQNLLPNPSFEDTLPKSKPLYEPTSWRSPTTGSPDLYVPFENFNRSVPLNVVGFQFAHTGFSYMGLSIYALARPNDSKRYREYIQNEMQDSLIKDSVYCLQLFVSLADSSRYASRNKLGVYFSTDQIRSNDFFYLPVKPQLIVSPNEFIANQQEWLQFNLKYKATGGEKFITIGNFTDSTEIDTLFVGGGKDEQWKETYYYIDDVYLGSCDSVPFDTNVGIREQDLIERQHKVYPNPAATHFTLELEVKAQEQMVLNLYDLQGRIHLTQPLQPARLHNIAIDNLTQGVYFYHIQNEKGKMLSGKLMVE